MPTGWETVISLQATKYSWKPQSEIAILAAISFLITAPGNRKHIILP
jgi:hypothetical protein